MNDTPVFSGRYFDGHSAVAHEASVAVSTQMLIIETQKGRHDWAYADLEKAPAQGEEIRLANRTLPDALVILPTAAQSALETHAPALFSNRAERRRMTALIGSLIAGAGAVAALLFIGVPAASGPMARSTPKAFEAQIGENIAAQINTVFRPCGSDVAMEAITPVIADLAERGDVGFEVRFQFVRTSMPNAFALPGGQVMATTGLLDAVGDDQEAFLAVIAHELGHVRARDSMQAVYRNAGLGIMLEVITGGSGAGQQLVLIGGQLNQLRHTRKQENRADEAAFDIMTRADLNPAALARAFAAIIGHASENGDEETGRFSTPDWFKSHPDTDQRIEQAKSQARESGPLPLSAESWDAVRNACKAVTDEEEEEGAAEEKDKAPAP